MLDRLRADRKLPEEQDFRQWKAQLHEAYRAVEPKEHLWHLPDGRTLRVVTTPNPEGGITYLYDDVTERLDMDRRYDALIKVQSETLDNLAEAVAVFGSDGRVRLHNPAFARMWKLQPEALEPHPHVEAITAWCQALHDDNTVWRSLRAAVTAIDNREPMAARIERRDGMVIDLATMPLPDGATLATFQDVTDTVNVERVLRERNEALVDADGIKIDFVHHVSYELRSPLTNIIGFAHFLGDPAFGPLNDKQREYLGYITASTNALLALINNILDLATIDAGAMTLSLTEVDIRASMEAAAEGVQDRLAKDHLRLDIRVPPASAASPPTSGGCARSCSICCPTRWASRRRGERSRLPPSGGRMPWCSPSSTAARAFRRRRPTRCSTGSRPIRAARSTAAPASDCHWCARSSSCTAARCDRFRRRRGNHGDLRLPDGAGGEKRRNAKRGVATAAGTIGRLCH